MTKDEKKKRGIYGKYSIARADREDRAGRKHENCQLFVLDITHDPHARPAARAYAASARADGYGPLADELEMWCDRAEKAEREAQS